MSAGEMGSSASGLGNPTPQVSVGDAGSAAASSRGEVDFGAGGAALGEAAYGWRGEAGTHGAESPPSLETGAQLRAAAIERSFEAAHFEALAERSAQPRQGDGLGAPQRTDQVEPPLHSRVTDRLSPELIRDADVAAVRRELLSGPQIAQPSLEQPPEASAARLQDAGKANSPNRIAPSENAAERKSEDESYIAMHRKLEPYLGQADTLNKAFEKDPALFGKLEKMGPDEADARLRQVVEEPSQAFQRGAIEPAAPSGRRDSGDQGRAERDNPDHRSEVRAEQEPQRSDSPKSPREMKNDVDYFRIAGERAKFIADARAELKAEVAKQDREDYFNSDHARMVKYLALREAEFMRRSFNREDTSKIEIEL